MRKNLYLGAVALAAVAMTSCSSDDVAQEIRQDNAIQFGTYVGNAAQSRAAMVDTDAELQAAGFGVYAYYTAQDAWADYASKETPNFMDNQKVTYSAGEWQYAPTKYWPNNTGDKLSFFAYAPYATAGNGITATQGSSEIAFAVNEAILDQTDLLYAEQTTSTVDLTKQTTTGVIPFEFKHALAAIALQVEAMNDIVNEDATGAADDSGQTDDNIADATTIAIKSVEITANFTNSGKLNTYTNAWTPDAAAARTYTYAPGDGKELITTVAEDVPDTKTQISADDAYLMVIPQDIENMTVKVVYTVTTVDANLATGSSVIENTITSDPFNISLEQNKKYNLCLHLGMTSVKMSASVEAWEDGGDVAVNVPINN